MSRFDRGHAPSVVRRILAGLFALSWFVFPGFGLIDLSVTWDPEWPQILEAGWGLYMTLLMGIPFTAIAVRPHAAAAAAVQLYVAAGALVVSAIAAFEWQLVVPGAVIVVDTVLVTGVWHPTPASFNQTWSGLCVLWGGAVSALSAFPHSRRAPGPS